MISQHYRGYDIEVSCLQGEERYAWRVTIMDRQAGAQHAHASSPDSCAGAAEAQDRAFQYARAWVELHPLHWPFDESR